MTAAGVRPPTRTTKTVVRRMALIDDTGFEAATVELLPNGDYRVDCGLCDPANDDQFTSAERAIGFALDHLAEHP